MSILDRYFAASEERLASVDENYKDCGAFALGSFDNTGQPDFSSLEQMQAAVQSVMAGADAFYAVTDGGEPRFNLNADSLTFTSAIPGSAINSRVHVQVVTRRANTAKAVIIVPHWNAMQNDYLTLAKILSWWGFSVFILTLPHHGKRTTNIPDHIANEFLNANLGAAISSIRQTVVDVRRLTTWLDVQGYERIDVIGISLGSCVASLVTAFEPKISRCALLMTAGDFARTVWTGRATARIQHTIKDHINVQQLQSIWAIISPAHFVDKMTANNTQLLFISCKRDSVVRFKLGTQFIQYLRDAGANVTARTLPCGHYTLGSFPFNLIMVAMLLRFLRRK